MGKAVTPINQQNRTQNFFPINADHDWKYKQLPIIASTDIQEGEALQIETSGWTTTWNLEQATGSNASGNDFVWILAEEIRSTDSDYATSGKLKGVYVPNNALAEAYFSVENGTFSLADVYKTVDIASNSRWLDVDTKWLGARITGYISSSRWVCNFNVPTTQTA